ncbi:MULTISPECIES: YggT family protein [Cryobacterium]|uniref:YggT family protein n=2 Tax=Cryobacterium levicorallinum TaxID=995038 RepID=A0ABY1EF17_9MICO|nr:MULTISPECIES: YggT family protein [Cryobacterium]GEP25462.1 membrane protein [Cryobacterium levicorallinum]SFH63907.1 YggT family protein [Cryobacterium levicorallinum]
MTGIPILGNLFYFLFFMYFLVLWGRFIIDLVRGVNRSWRPQGFLLVLVELVYTLTDPPVQFFRKLVPPLRIGPIALDFGFTLTMLCCIVGMSLSGLL